jgi:hypothetical protein
LGNVYKVNSPVHPNLEFSITHFSQLYLQETGHSLTPNSTISLGGAAGSFEDDGISEAFVPEQSFTLSAATPPTHVCPPASPPVLINPHQNRHINTAHPELVRVTVLGSSGFNVTNIIPSTVTLGGAHPLFSFTRRTIPSGFLDETFVFDGDQINLPAGITQATLTGSLTDGTTFSTTQTIFNRNYSFYSAGQQAQQQSKWSSRGADIPDLPSIISRYERNQNKAVIFTYTGGSVTPAGSTGASASAAADAPRETVRMAKRAAAAAATPAASTNTIPTGTDSSSSPVVSIRRRQAATPSVSHSANVPARLQDSMNQYLQSNSTASGAGAS